tara:strand:+ start:1789 stop:2244 length:456 start_codon:yes stop_codon:yes gene_type:complete
MRKVKYYLMRHGHYYDSKNQFITYHGMLQLKSSMDELEKEIKNNSPNRKIRIIHSEVQRAKHTALLIREILPVECELIGNSDLNCGKYRINEDLVKKIVSKGDSDNLVCIILSHQPDIELFCDKTLSTSKYLPLEIYLEEEIKDEDDDLPF